MQTQVIRLDEATAKRVSDVLEESFPLGEISISAFVTAKDPWSVEVFERVLDGFAQAA